jgi:hypothetical protein
MSVRYIVRPMGILSTPKRLKEVLNASRTIRSDSVRLLRSRSVNWENDLYLSYPLIPHLATCEPYQIVREFYKYDKGQQRSYLRAFVKTPDSYISNQYVVRPRHHRAGHDFVITEYGQTEINPYTHYVSPLFPKVKEYRVIFVKGVPLITLRKVFNSITPDPTLPWNHAQGATFQTINGGHSTSSLRHTSCISDLLNVPVVQHAHLIGVDVMMDAHNNYAVCEINFCPSISIEANLQTIKETLCPGS